jgi:NAD+ synthase (glutamine-hydrolysing)
MVFGPEGDLLARGGQFTEELVVVDLDLDSVMRRRLREPRKRQGTSRTEPVVLGVPRFRGERPALPPRSIPAPLSDDAEVYQALVVGTRDYVRKNRFGKVVVALSGGIDSALTAAIAVDAIGSENVVGVMMPSEFSSKGSVDDSVALGRSLGIELITMPITDLMRAYGCALADAFAGREPDVTEENIQARIRGNLVMALSNKFGWLVLSTGNKSEVSVGYCTLYGDMAGGFAVLKDVTKTAVYRLAHFVNETSGSERIPTPIIDKVPSAELRPDQKDSDSLPPYAELDPILLEYVEEDRGVEEMVRMGFNRETVERIVALVDRSEYKRRQAAPGVKITPRAFGRDRRMPITNRFEG